MTTTDSADSAPPPLLLEGARLIDPEAGTEAPGWLLVADGRIAAMGTPGDPAPEAARRHDCAGACLAPGIVDMGVQIGEPGARHLESFRSAGRAAAAGGVTTIVTRADTDPAIDSPEMLDYVRRRAAAECAVRVAPMAALTRDRAGREMAEFGFLADAGAVAFGDGPRALRDSRVLARAMTYAAGLGALIVTHPQDPWLSEGAAATSGKFATLRGLPAAPAMAERLGLDRDLGLARMTGARCHADQITTACALPALSRARDAGLDISAGTSIHHATLNEIDIGPWRSFFRLTPPLRAEEDRRAVVAALAGGAIDVLCSMHTPLDEESKRQPFEAAAPGAVGLETLLPAALRLYHSGDMTLPALFRALAFNPARRLGLEGGRLCAGAPADLVLFDPDAPFILDRFALASKSRNTPFDGARLQGRVKATFVGGRQINPPEG